MTKAIALRQSVSQVFKKWAEKKGARYFKAGYLVDHIRSFYDESGLNIAPYIAHALIERLVRQRNRKASEEKVTVVLFYRPNLRRQFC